MHELVLIRLRTDQQQRRIALSAADDLLKNMRKRGSFFFFPVLFVDANLFFLSFHLPRSYVGDGLGLCCDIFTTVSQQPPEIQIR